MILQPQNGRIKAGRIGVISTFPALTDSNIRGIEMAQISLPEPVSTSKRCTKCSEVKLLKDFPKDPRKKDGSGSPCKVCKQAYASAWAQRNKARLAALARERYHSSPTLPEKNKQRNYEWRKKNREKHLEIKRQSQWRCRAKEMGVSLEEYLRIREEREAKATETKVRRDARLEQIETFGVVLKIRKGKRICPMVSIFDDRERSREYYWNNLEYGRSKVRKWAAANPAKRSAQHYRRRVNFQSTVCDLTEEQWAGIKEAYLNRCAYCGESKPLTQDHVVPVSKGGQHTALNIVPACQSCNSSKGKRMRMLPVIQNKKVLSGFSIPSG